MRRLHERAQLSTASAPVKHKSRLGHRHSVVSPFKHILERIPQLSLTLTFVQATEALRITSPELVKFRIMDEIIPEPLGGAHSDPMAAFPAVKDAIMRTYHQCARSPPPRALEQPGLLLSRQLFFCSFWINV